MLTLGMLINFETVDLVEAPPVTPSLQCLKIEFYQESRSAFLVGKTFNRQWLVLHNVYKRKYNQ